MTYETYKEVEGTPMEYDARGRTRCPDCGGVHFYLRLSQGDSRPGVECEACNMTLRFGAVPLDILH